MAVLSIALPRHHADPDLAALSRLGLSRLRDRPRPADAPPVHRVPAGDDGRDLAVALLPRCAEPGRLALTLLVAALIYAPYALWVSTHIDSIGDAAREYVASWEIDTGWLERAGNAAASFGRALLEFTLPLSLFWMMLFWTLWLPMIYPIFARRNTDEEPHELAWRKLFVAVGDARRDRLSGQRGAGRAGLQGALDDAGAVHRCRSGCSRM